MSSCSQHASFCTVQSVTGVLINLLSETQTMECQKQTVTRCGIHLTFRPLTLHHNPPNGIAQCQVYALPARPLTPHVSQACIVIRIASFMSFRTRTNTLHANDETEDFHDLIFYFYIEQYVQWCSEKSYFWCFGSI